MNPGHRLAATTYIFMLMGKIDCCKIGPHVFDDAVLLRHSLFQAHNGLKLFEPLLTMVRPNLSSENRCGISTYLALLYESVRL